MATYTGKYTPENWFVVLKDNKPFSHEPSLKIRDHSPTGFAWGYGGSGPAQLALALLLEETNRKTAERLYQDFKWQIISNLTKDIWQLTSKEIQDWVKNETTQSPC